MTGCNWCHAGRYPVGGCYNRRRQNPAETLGFSPDYESGGQGFESLPVRQFSWVLLKRTLVVTIAVWGSAASEAPIVIRLEIATRPPIAYMRARTASSISAVCTLRPRPEPLVLSHLTAAQERLSRASRLAASHV